MRRVHVLFFLAGCIATACSLLAGAGAWLEDAQAGELPTVNLYARPASVFEDGTGASDLIVLTVVRNSGADRDLAVHLDFSEGTAVRGLDYTFVSDMLVIRAGQYSASAMARPINDDLLEGHETVVASLHRNPDPTPDYQVGPQGRASVLLLDDESLAQVSVEATDPIAREPRFRCMPDSATFVLRRKGPLDNELKVAVRLAGTALPGADYTTWPVPTNALSCIVFPPGQARVVLRILPRSDGIVEPTETVVLAVLPDPVRLPRYRAQTGAGTAVAWLLDGSPAASILTSGQGSPSDTQGLVAP